MYNLYNFKLQYSNITSVMVGAWKIKGEPT